MTNNTEHGSNRLYLAAKLILSLGLWATLLPAEPAGPSRVELADGWRLVSASRVQADGATVSVAGFPDSGWYPIRRMPATVLQILQENGVCTDLYVGKNLLEKVPQDLYRQDWWYRTAFTTPAGMSAYTLEFPGINYRAEIWLNGRKIADNTQVVGMYAAHEFDVTRWVRPGASNALAVKVTPERLIQDVDGVELADSWFDWINWKYLGYKGPKKNPGQGVSFVPDRNAGVWKPVYLRSTGAVSLLHPFVGSDLSPSNSTARLTVYATLRNLSAAPVSGALQASVSRKGKSTIALSQPVTLSPGEQRELRFDSERYPNLVVAKPDLWWPYTLGAPALYDLDLRFIAAGHVSDTAHTRFGIRRITQLRDNDEQFPDVGKGGNFYLQVNGRDFRVRGADYAPDLLYRYDPEREAQILAYVKDLGINMLRWESKISSQHIVELAGELGIPVMFGWMCCNQWEKWNQWSEEDHRVAALSLRSQIQMLRPHAAVFLWANASDGRPPEPLRLEYRRILSELHWPNAIVDTVSSFAKGPDGNRLWDGIHMEGPYSWRPPSYWFGAKLPASRGACAEQGDNEHIPTLESLKKFIPADQLWPINDTWLMHGGAWPENSTLGNIQRALQNRYGPSDNVEDFVRKAQLAHYENTRAQFEAFAAGPWANHKMTLYWMLNSHWPSFYGNLIDYYLSPGGAYYGAKRGLRPLSVVFDAYAGGDRSQARIIVFNQTPKDVKGLRVRVRVYDLDGKVRDDRSRGPVAVAFNDATEVLTLPRYPDASPVFFVRCQLFDARGALVVDNTYWQSQRDDVLGPRSNDGAMSMRQDAWADMTALNTMPRGAIQVSARQTMAGGLSHVTVRLRNPSEHVAFFERATVSAAREGNELLPIQYDDNYIAVFPGETVQIHATLAQGAKAGWVRIEGYNTPATAARIE